MLHNLTQLLEYTKRRFDNCAACDLWILCVKVIKICIARIRSCKRKLNMSTFSVTYRILFPLMFSDTRNGNNVYYIDWQS